MSCLKEWFIHEFLCFVGALWENAELITGPVGFEVGSK